MKGGPVTWEIFQATFVDRFFPREIREEKVMEFINLHKGGRSVHKYSLDFVKLSKYCPSLFSESRDEMRNFVTRVLKELEEECQSAMLHDNMNISHLMVYARRVEEARGKRKSRDSKMAMSFDGGSSKNRFGIEDKPKLRSRVQIKSPPNSQELVVIGCLTLNLRR